MRGRCRALPGSGAHRPRSATPPWVVERLAEVLLVPLPDQPVGAGARWAVRRPVDLGGGSNLWAIEETTYKLAPGQIPELAAIEAATSRVPLGNDRGLLPLDAPREDVVTALRELAGRDILELSHQVNTHTYGRLRAQVARRAPYLGVIEGQVETTFSARVGADDGQALELRATTFGRSRPMGEPDAGS